MADVQYQLVNPAIDLSKPIDFAAAINGVPGVAPAKMPGGLTVGNLMLLTFVGGLGLTLLLKDPLGRRRG